ncbi:zinc finger HIT domain-containing protein 2 [Pyrus ussuriensis x Pyrus communis]|uniref:Zinc finger HIT domain-containing protein 2 n=1 Tax=Pyrus ussuriensis x Pyrus communis TaxID=2448454 RepID=A0A5N5H5Z4_9ROSA|nr:zinc finger HIT domain-containing protein 2 [Pyrus ussuriensis x Pyrus communis]
MQLILLFAALLQEQSPVYRIVYARECGGEMGQLGPHDEMKQKMLDILKRLFHSEEEETDDMDDDDDANMFLFYYFFPMKFMDLKFNDAFGEFSIAGILYVHCEIYEKFVIDGFLELYIRSLLLMNS